MPPTVNASSENDSGTAEVALSGPSIASRVDRTKDLIEKRRLAIPGEYRFDWQGLAVKLSLAPGGDSRDTTLARLTFCLGLLPYTAEDREGRANAVDMALRVNIRGWDRIRFTADGGLELCSESLIPTPADTAGLVGGLTAWLICLDRDLMPLRMLLKPVERRQAA